MGQFDEGEGMTEALQFQGCDSETVFREVSAKARSAEARTLWARMLGELQRNGVDGATSFLEAEFDQIRDDLKAEIQRLKAEG